MHTCTHTHTLIKNRKIHTNTPIKYNIFFLKFSATPGVRLPLPPAKSPAWGAWMKYGFILKRNGMVVEMSVG